uniref:NAD(P)-dependent oxidoreductase n=1 Tax=Granulicella sp. dw_53 TaxID=2719792 RepID=UPI001C4A3359
MDLFPIFLKLTGRPCLVIGAGNLAESKIESLRAANGKVTVIAPQPSPPIPDPAAAGEIEYPPRPFAPPPPPPPPPPPLPPPP